MISNSHGRAGFSPFDFAPPFFPCRRTRRTTCFFSARTLFVFPISLGTAVCFSMESLFVSEMLPHFFSSRRSFSHACGFGAPAFPSPGQGARCLGLYLASECFFLGSRPAACPFFFFCSTRGERFFPAAGSPFFSPLAEAAGRFFRGGVFWDATIRPFVLPSGDIISS